MNGKIEKLPDDLTLRDYFAAAALQGMLSGDIDKLFPSPDESVSADIATHGGQEWYTGVAYELANAMLKARA